MAKEPLHLDFSDAETQRNRLSEAQAKSIRDLYREASKEVGKWAERAPRVPSDALRKEYLNRLQGEINRELRGIERQLDGTVRNNMTEVVQATVGDAKAFAQNFGLSIQGAYSHVPTEIVRAVASGQLYEGNWTLSKALWLNTVETQRDVQNIVAKGILENRSAYDIAKDLEKYVNPDARKDWDWSKVYPGTRKVIDYNAQRLARTMVSHAYQQAFVRTTQKNPFITKYEWRAADTERTCQLCLDRDGQYFAKDDLPLDHPNGMCTFLAVIEDDFNTIADRLADWAHGAEDPALDNWAKDLYGKGWQAKKEQAQPKEPKAKTKGEKALTPKQVQKAKEWDAQYQNVVAFAKSTGRDVESTVKAILGKPPVGSVHYKGTTTSKATAKPNAPNSSFRASQAKDMSRKDANSYIKTMIERLGYSSRTKSASDDYMMFSDDMNAYLRGLSRVNEYGASIDALRAAMSKGPQEVVYRGCDSKTLGISPTLSESEIQRKLIGSIFGDKGFLSTSKTSDVAREFSDRGINGDSSDLPTIMTILVPSDANRMYINSGLGEVLLDTGSRMEVTEASIQDGVLHVTASVIS